MTLHSRARQLWLHLRAYLHDIVEKVWFVVRSLVGLIPRDTGHPGRDAHAAITHTHTYVCTLTRRRREQSCGSLE